MSHIGLTKSVIFVWYWQCLNSHKPKRVQICWGTYLYQISVVYSWEEFRDFYGASCHVVWGYHCCCLRHNEFTSYDRFDWYFTCNCLLWPSAYCGHSPVLAVPECLTPLFSCTHVLYNMGHIGVSIMVFENYLVVNGFSPFAVMNLIMQCNDIMCSCGDSEHPRTMKFSQSGWQGLMSLIVWRIG